MDRLAVRRNREKLPPSPAARETVTVQKTLVFLQLLPVLFFLLSPCRAVRAARLLGRRQRHAERVCLAVGNVGDVNVCSAGSFLWARALLAFGLEFTLAQRASKRLLTCVTTTCCKGRARPCLLTGFAGFSEN